MALLPSAGHTKRLHSSLTVEKDPMKFHWFLPNTTLNRHLAMSSKLEHQGNGLPNGGNEDDHNDGILTITSIDL